LYGDAQKKAEVENEMKSSHVEYQAKKEQEAEDRQKKQPAQKKQ